MLFAAARSGNLQALRDAVRGDAEVLLKLHSRGSVDTPLHLASMIGQVDFVREQRSAVEELCMKTDLDGKTALHSAVVGGKIDVIDVLFVHCSQAANLVTLLQETVLHLAVKHHQQQGLQFLIDQKLGLSVASLLNLGDREGNTIVHLATTNKQLQTVEYLVKQPNLNVNAENLYGLRALDITFAYAFNSKDVYIEEAIRLAGGCRSQTTTTTSQIRPYTRNTSIESTNLANEWWKELRSGIIVMASVFTTVTFQVALTPPGGVWQDWGSNTTTSNSSVVLAHQPGVPILYDLDREQFNKLRAPWNVPYIVLGPYLVLFNVLFIVVKFLSIESIMTKKSLTSSHLWRSYYLWLLILVLSLFTFAFNNIVYFLPVGRRPRAPRNAQSSSNSSSGNAHP
ncbi:UNVERIFIED_CONTAM: hypothetical protein Sangu_1681200 [Sesamum angustifolium]|uniref:PGG domain-containing protein n=1 Tax=Sesamum angustifolium TaxID=2727405 RepID=A0AAW2MJ77_9LAMI